MLDAIIKFSLKNRMAVLVAMLLISVLGIYTMQQMEIDVFPDLNAPTVVVMTETHGMAPEETERLVTFPIETALNGASGVRRVRSQSTMGFSVVWVEFQWGTDVYRDRQIVSEKLQEVASNLPPTVGQPVLGPQTSILGEVLIVGLTSDSVSQEDLRTLADWTIRPRLQSVGGVAQVSIVGGEAKEYQILLNPDLMRHYNVTLNDVRSSVEDMNSNAPGGILYDYGNEYIIRGMLHTQNIEDLQQTVVCKTDGAPVLLSQIAEIRTGGKSPRSGAASNNGKPAVIVTVSKQQDTGTLQLTEQLLSALDDLKKEMPESVHVDTDIFRQSRFIESSIGNIRDSLFTGAVLVVVVLFLFLMNVRTTLISLVTIPLSLLITILILNMMGITINTMTIGGMAIAIGSLVDDAIVDVENVWKRLRQSEASQHSALGLVYEASREVRIPILSSTLIIVASFVPLFFLSGMEGRMLIPLGVAFILSLFASTFVALTLTPVLCSLLLKRPSNSARQGEEGAEPFLTRQLKRIYKVGLQAVLRHQRVVLACTMAFVVAAIGLFCTFGHSFLPPFNEGSFTINVSTLPGVSLEESERIGMEAEEVLMKVPEIITVARKTGRAELDEHALGVNVSEIEAPYELTSRSRSEVVADVRQRLSRLHGCNVEIGQPISHRIDAMLSGTQANVAIKLFGTDLNRMYKLGQEIHEAIEDIPGVADLNVEQQVERPQLKITPRRTLLAHYGITPKEFGETLEIMLGGLVVSQVYEGNRAFDITLRADERFRDDIEKVRNLLIDTQYGPVPMSTIADVQSSSGPNTINRENVERKLVISANVEGRSLSDVVEEMKESIGANVQLPEDYHIEFGGQFESEQRASRILGLTSLLSLIIIFLLLYHQFRKAGQATVVMLNLPLALIGGVAAVWMSGGVISIPSIIGFISLFGIATRNGILLIDRYNDLHQQGLPVRECVLRGSLDRLNPIIMTALTSALALIPLVIGDDLPGNEIQSPMAKVMLGGLLSSTLLNGFVIPVMYSLMTKEK